MTLTYPPASEVPQRLGVLLEKINGINQKTKFREIVQLYREFVVIHPFIDGNGRTARILLDFMAMKAGFQPINHKNDYTRDVIYKSIDEIVFDLSRRN